MSMTMGAGERKRRKGRKSRLKGRKKEWQSKGGCLGLVHTGEKEENKQKKGNKKKVAITESESRK